jgi:hypothetical protein
MNWFKKYKTAIRGEWWIVDGTAVFADAEVGDYNHSGVVIDSILSQHDLDPYKFDIDAHSEEQLMEIGMSKEEIDAITDKTDPREYGLKHLGWKRINENNIQTQTLASEDLRHIANGLYDIDNNIQKEEEFNIYVNGPGKYYSDVRYEDIESEQPERIMKSLEYS